MKRFFRPEIFNRLDRVITFAPLTQAIIDKVTLKELQEIGLREGLLDRNITLTFDDMLVHAVAKVGFDPVYGARPLQRKIESTVTTPLARYLIESPMLNDVTLHLSLASGSLAIAQGVN